MNLSEEALVKQENPETPNQLKVEVDPGSDGEVLGEEGELADLDSDYSPSEAEIPQGEGQTASPRRLREKKSARYRFTRKTIVDNRRTFPKPHSPRRRAVRGNPIFKLRSELAAARQRIALLTEENALLPSVSGGRNAIGEQGRVGGDSETVAKTTHLCDLLLLVSPKWIKRLVEGDTSREEAVSTIFELMRDGLTNQKYLDRLFERLVVKPTPLNSLGTGAALETSHL